MLARVIVQIVLFLALQGAGLCVVAETVEWPGACALLGIIDAGSLASQAPRPCATTAGELWRWTAIRRRLYGNR